MPHWVRGCESAELIEPVPQPLVMLGLGGSIGTPPEGIAAEVLVVESFEELEAAGEAARGRIVLFNAPFTTYGATVPYRIHGPSKAAQQGAVAALVRSIGPSGLRTPHTGSLRYENGVPPIPAAAVTVEDAEMLHRMQRRGERVRVRLCMEARTLPDAPSANVIGELRGREKPEEIVLIGAHLDSWDVSPGATDDGAGCIVTWEAARLLRRLDLRPRRTVRVVLFTNEENGCRGALGYRDAHGEELPRHVLALEADCGAGRPLGFGLTAGPEGLALAREIAGLLAGVGADRVWESGGGTDVNVLREHGVPTMGLRNDESLYWNVHHTPADTLERIDPADLARCVAAVAVMAYGVAEMPGGLTSSAPWDPGGCWTLCTERARRAISWAQEEAGQAGMPEVETEHLLLAMLCEDNLGAGVLVRCGVSLDTLRSAVQQEMTSGPAGRGRVTRLGPRARRALDLAREEGEAMDPVYVGCEQLLLGLLRDKEGLAARVLTRLGVTQECCRREIPLVGGWWWEVGEAEAHLRDGDTPEHRRRLQEALAAYHAFIRQTPRLEARPE